MLQHRPGLNADMLRLCRYRREQTCCAKVRLLLASTSHGAGLCWSRLAATRGWFVEVWRSGFSTHIVVKKLASQRRASPVKAWRSHKQPPSRAEFPSCAADWIEHQILRRMEAPILVSVFEQFLSSQLVLSLGELFGWLPRRM